MKEGLSNYVCFFNPTWLPWEPRPWFYVRPTYTLRSLALKKVTYRRGIKSHFPYPCAPSLCRCGWAPWSKPIDMGNLINDISRSKSGIWKLFLVLNFEYYLDFTDIGKFWSKIWMPFKYPTVKLRNLLQICNEVSSSEPSVRAQF